MEISSWKVVIRGLIELVLFYVIGISSMYAVISYMSNPQNMTPHYEAIEIINERGDTIGYKYIDMSILSIYKHGT